MNRVRDLVSTEYQVSSSSQSITNTQRIDSSVSIEEHSSQENSSSFPRNLADLTATGIVKFISTHHGIDYISILNTIGQGQNIRLLTTINLRVLRFRPPEYSLAESFVEKELQKLGSTVNFRKRRCNPKKGHGGQGMTSDAA
ncbi:hypothetical protein E4T56_gene10561 [Termitomyces sp. T112]|nr:hypothetical protein E4T56_gene10561 [Termitomyces sp. T112]